jgi:CubicO group peptidase (beta-lactamase class C family)
MPTQHRMAAGLLAALLSLAAPAAPPSPFDHASSAAAQSNARADTLATPRRAPVADTRAAPRAPAAYAPATSRRATAADTLALVDAVFARWNGSASPGCAAGVSRGGRIALARAWGMADLEHGVPNTTGTVFEAGSVSKQFTAAAVILLEQQGRLSLGDDVRRWIPELPDYGTTITIRQLLDHTSGLRDWGSVAAIAGWPRGERTHSHDHVLEILARQRALNYAPGSEYSYTNSGYNLAVIIVERASGESFAEFSRRTIFEPLGLRDTQWRDDYRRIVPRRATAYSRRGDGYIVDRPIEHVHGHGGLLTTIADLLTWNEALAAGTIGGAVFVEAMHRRGVLSDGTEIDYAAGISVGSYRDVREVSHTAPRPATAPCCCATRTSSWGWRCCATPGMSTRRRRDTRSLTSTWAMPWRLCRSGSRARRRSGSGRRPPPGSSPRTRASTTARRRTRGWSWRRTRTGSSCGAAVARRCGCSPGSATSSTRPSAASPSSATTPAGCSGSA